jgi:hypothetical protein
MSSCNGQPKTTEVKSTSVVFVNDTKNQKVDVQLNGTHFTSYHYQASLPKPVLFPLITASGKTLTRRQKKNKKKREKKSRVKSQ